MTLRAMTPRATTPRHLLIASALAAAVTLAACKKDEPAVVAPPASSSLPSTPLPDATSRPAAANVAVTGINLGRDEAVGSPTNTFAKGDTIYASVSTQTNSIGNVPATLGVKWTHVDSNQTVNEESRQIDFNGPGTTTFHIAKPDGWPTGNYRVEVSVDGTVVDSASFNVQ